MPPNACFEPQLGARAQQHRLEVHRTHSCGRAFSAKEIGPRARAQDPTRVLSQFRGREFTVYAPADRALVVCRTCAAKPRFLAVRREEESDIVVRVPTREPVTAQRVRSISCPRRADILPLSNSPVGRLLISRFRVRFTGGALGQKLGTSGPNRERLVMAAPTSAHRPRAIGANDIL